VKNVEVYRHTEAHAILLSAHSGELKKNNSFQNSNFIEFKI
jgi:hypothetical protein